MKVETVWIVKDATKHSTLEDCLFRTTVDRIDHYIMGSPLNAWRTESHAVYTTPEEALADAKARLERGPVQREDVEDTWQRALAAAASGSARPEEAPPHVAICRALGAGVAQRYDRALRAARDLERNAHSLVRALVEGGVGAVTSGNGYEGSTRHVTEALAELSVAREAFGTAYRATERVEAP